MVMRLGAGNGGVGPDISNSKNSTMPVLQLRGDKSGSSILADSILGRLIMMNATTTAPPTATTPPTARTMTMTNARIH